MKCTSFLEHPCVYFSEEHPIIVSPAVIYCFVYYLWVGHNYCYAYLAVFTGLLLLPGEISTARQSLSVYHVMVLNEWNE